MKILVINTMCIGDIVLTTPVFHVLKKNIPDSHIAMLTDMRYQAVLENNPNIDEFISLDKKGIHKSCKGVLKVLSEIRKRKFDVVINLSCNERSIFFTLLSGAKKKLGYKHKGQGFFLDGSVPFADIPAGKRHFADSNVDIIRFLNLPDYSHNGPEIFPDSRDYKFADEFWQKAGVNAADLVVGFNIGANWPSKRWIENGFRAVAEKIKAKYQAEIVFFGSPDDLPLVKRVTAGLSFQPVIAAGKTTLRQLSALMRRCQAILTNDTGPMHIAVASGVRVVAIYGPSPVGSFAPYGEGNTVICHHIGCSPCGRHECTDHRCMKEITPEEVLKEIEKCLTGKN